MSRFYVEFTKELLTDELLMQGAPNPKTYVFLVSPCSVFAQSIESGVKSRINMELGQHR